MRFRYLLLAVALAVAPATVWADDFEDGYAAAKAGDYATALRLWRPLAEQGSASAQYNLGVMYDKGEGVPQDYVRLRNVNGILGVYQVRPGGRLRWLEQWPKSLEEET